MIAGLIALSPFVSLFADGKSDLPPIPHHEHRINFGLFNIGYERIQPDSIYTGVDMKVASFLLNEKDNSNTLNHYVNGEIRLGYNHQLDVADCVTGYAGVGFSVFSAEKQEGKLRNWNYTTAGVKYLHQFGEIFEMGLHLKGHLSLSQKRYIATKAKKPEMKQPDFFIFDDPESPRIEANEDISEGSRKTSLTAVNVDDSRFIVQIGVPMIWHVGENKNWEIQFEPYYMQIPNKSLTQIIGSNLSIGYSY